MFLTVQIEPFINVEILLKELFIAAILSSVTIPFVVNPLPLILDSFKLQFLDLFCITYFINSRLFFIIEIIVIISCRRANALAFIILMATHCF